MLAFLRWRLWDLSSALPRWLRTGSPSSSGSDSKGKEPLRHIKTGRLMTLNGERWIGAFVPASKVNIAGYANRNVLRPGVVVRLSAEFDRKTLAALEPIADLAIVSPRPGESAGIFPDEVIDPTEPRRGRHRQPRNYGSSTPLPA